MARNFIQWTTPDDTHFFPAGRVELNLPPGYYSIGQDMSGLFFKRKPVRTEALLRFPDSASDLVIEEIETFWNKEKTFHDADIPFKRGILLYGSPGGGKTCTIRLVIKNLVENRSGVVVEFSSPSLLKEGYEVLRTIHTDIPIIVLMEDIDAILNRYDESDVLNLLDGVYGINKVVFLATTNTPEKLGSRIMNRPSRFDKRIFIGMPSSEARAVYLKTKLTEDAEIAQWVEDTEGFSIAHLKELYVATKILGDSYDRALKELKGMKKQPMSQDFDDYGVLKAEKASYGYQPSEPCCEAVDPAQIAESMSEDVRFNNGRKLLLG
jgi:SpoVK/Ycf46/Vps4 family AAA+-type ATPase